MTKKEVLSSPYFYLKPNDIVYVPPLKGKQFSFATFPYGIVFSALSTTLLLINFFKKPYPPVALKPPAILAGLGFMHMTGKFSGLARRYCSGAPSR